MADVRASPRDEVHARLAQPNLEPRPRGVGRELKKRTNAIPYPIIAVTMKTAVALCTSSAQTRWTGRPGRLAAPAINPKRVAAPAIKTGATRATFLDRAETLFARAVKGVRFCFMS